MRAEIAKWAFMNGCRPAAKKYDIAESTIRGFMKSYKEENTMEKCNLLVLQCHIIFSLV